jgi:quercetin dioxygenase-like cupin family protein
MTTVEKYEVQGAPHAQLFPGAEPKTIRLTLEAGERVEPHRHPDREVVLYVVDGALELQLGSEHRELETGDVVRFEGDQDISPRATEGSTALIVLSRQSE